MLWALGSWLRSVDLNQDQRAWAMSLDLTHSETWAIAHESVGMTLLEIALGLGHKTETYDQDPGHIKVCGALGPLGLWPKTKAFGLGYGPRSTTPFLGLRPRTLVLDLGLRPLGGSWVWVWGLGV